MTARSRTRPDLRYLGAAQWIGARPYLPFGAFYRALQLDAIARASAWPGPAAGIYEAQDARHAADAVVCDPSGKPRD